MKQDGRNNRQIDLDCLVSGRIRRDGGMMMGDDRGGDRVDQPSLVGFRCCGPNLVGDMDLM
jgi:hypothetical protein